MYCGTTTTSAWTCATTPTATPVASARTDMSMLLSVETTASDALWSWKTSSDSSSDSVRTRPALRRRRDTDAQVVSTCVVCCESNPSKPVLYASTSTSAQGVLMETVRYTTANWTKPCGRDARWSDEWGVPQGQAGQLRGRAACMLHGAWCVVLNAGYRVQGTRPPLSRSGSPVASAVVARAV